MLRIVWVLVAFIAMQGAPAWAVVFDDDGVHVINSNNSFPLEPVEVR